MMLGAIKALHILAIISWMAGLLYLPRLFVYHASQNHESEASALFTVMERRLYRAIMTPAMVVAWISGLYLAWFSFQFQGGWLHAKLALVLGMSIHHGFQGRWRRAFAEGRNVYSSRFYRFQNEVPTLLMVGIVILVVVKPM